MMDGEREIIERLLRALEPLAALHDANEGRERGMTIAYDENENPLLNVGDALEALEAIAVARTTYLKP